MIKVAIIGAGVSGLAAAFRLSQTGVNVTVFEKSKGLSGRAASRTKNGCRYDHGANYFKTNLPEVKQFIFEELPTDNLCKIEGEIAAFDQEGTISPGDPNQNAEAKWNYREGISTLGKLIVAAGDLTVSRGTQITGIHYSGNEWTLQDSTGSKHEGFDALLLSAPAPQTIDLLKSGNLDPELAQVLTDELSCSQYHTQFTVVQNFKGNYQLPGDAYALINTDRKHEVAWLSHENQKDGRVPESETLFIAQMSPTWSQNHYDDDRDEIIRIAYEATNQILDGVLPDLNWADTQRWRYAHPHSAAKMKAMKPAFETGLFFCGDAFVGKGRVPESIETGFAAANEIKERFDVS